MSVTSVSPAAATPATRAARFKWRDVYLRARTLQFGAASAKNKRAKTLPLAGDVLAILARRAADHDPAVPFVFKRATGGRLALPAVGAWLFGAARGLPTLRSQSSRLPRGARRPAPKSTRVTRSGRTTIFQE